MTRDADEGTGVAARDVWRPAPAAAAFVAVVLASAAGAAVLGPFPVTAGVARLAGWVLLATGASVLVGRTGTVDLSTAATAAVGAYVGAVALPIVGTPALLGLAAAAVVGAAVGAANGAMAGRVGGHLAALPTLSVGLAAVAVVRAWPGSGGAAGFHAAPFLTGGEVGDAVAVVVLAAVGLAVVTAWWGTRGAARASVGARQPGALAAMGHRPAVATAVAGALGGALLGAGGAAQAMVSGSVTPAAFGLPLAATLALAAVLGGGPPMGPLVGALWLWGPAVVFPLAPIVGDAPPLLTVGVAGLALLAWRRGRPLVPAVPAPPMLPAPSDPVAAPTDGTTTGAAAPDAPVLEVPATAGHDALVVRPGEVVAVVGPNGVGKSTLLARIGGQLPDPAGTRLHGDPAPRGAVRRARSGLGRGWQRAPRVPTADLLAAAGAATLDLPARVRAAIPEAIRDSRAAAQLVAAASGRPAVVLLDEPATALPEAVVAEVVTVLAAAGVGVVLVDHRPAVLDVADRRCAVSSTSTAPLGSS